MIVPAIRLALRDRIVRRAPVSPWGGQAGRLGPAGADCQSERLLTHGAAGPGGMLPVAGRASRGGVRRQARRSFVSGRRILCAGDDP
jgi:hypothetical protein